MAVQKITFNQIANTGGLNGQVLAANSTAVYWKTISSGGFSNGQSISVNNFVVTGSATIPGYETRATANSRLANTNSRINLINTNLTGTNTALRTLISDRLQVANAVATYQTISTERAALANTNARITLVNTNLTGTNTALRTLISDRLQVANATATYETKATADSRLANTNAYIATKVNTTTFNSALANTNSFIKSQLANTNAYIATRASWTALTGTNTALRTLISDRLQVANAVATYATKSNPTTSGLLDHTGRVAISTNLSVTGNTTITGLVANGSLGTAGRVLKTNGTSVYWGVDATGTGGGGGGFSNGQSISVTNLVVTGNATVSGIIANGSLGTSGKVLKTNGTSVYWGVDNSLYTPRVFSNTSQSTLSWNSNSYEQYQLTGMTQTTTINADSGSPSNGQKIMFRFKDNGNSRTISWTTGTTNSFRAIGVTLPTTTVVSKTTYVGCVYNSTDSRWDVIAVAQET
jgi:chorismate mutase